MFGAQSILDFGANSNVMEENISNLNWQIFFTYTQNIHKHIFGNNNLHVFTKHMCVMEVELLTVEQ